MRNIFIIARRDLRAQFNSPVAYVVLGGTMLLLPGPKQYTKLGGCLLAVAGISFGLMLYRISVGAANTTSPQLKAGLIRGRLCPRDCEDSRT